MTTRLTSVAGLPPTSKLFHLDAYLPECDATVLRVEGDLVVLDRTVAYAESGGQVCDQGWIDGIPFLDVQKQGGTLIYINEDNPYGVDVPAVRIDTVVVHRLARPAPFVVGQPVHLVIDWKLRYQHMRQHSGSHFLFHAARVVYGRGGQPPLTVGCHIHARSARFDYAQKLAADLVPQVGEIANELIARGDRIRMVADPRTDEVSYWVYDEVVIPCGGTHVASSSEVGPLRVRRSAQGRGKDRLYSLLDDEVAP